MLNLNLLDIFKKKYDPQLRKKKNAMSRNWPQDGPDTGFSRSRLFSANINIFMDLKENGVYLKI